MALQISYTDKMGTTHSEAYAKIIEARINTIQKAVSVIVEIWHDSTARSKVNATATKQAVAPIYYVLKGLEYTTYMEDFVIKANGVSVLSSLYTWLKQHNDGTALTNESGSHLENQGNGIDWTAATDV